MRAFKPMWPGKPRRMHRLRRFMYGAHASEVGRGRPRPADKEARQGCRCPILRALLAAATLLAAGSANAFETFEAFTGFLDTNGIPYDRTNVVTAAIGGALQAVDAGARFVSAEAARALVARGEPVFGAFGVTTNRATLDAVELLPEGLAYLKVNALGPGSGAEILAHLRCLNDRTGVIIDLRGADGADLDAIAAVASPFRRVGEPLFAVCDLRGRELAVYAATSAVPCRVPVMLLIDWETRGSAEALAACSRGVPGVMTIGEPTRGESQLRELLLLTDGSFLYVATRRLVPAGRPAYDRTGVQPDVTVNLLDPGAFVNGDSPFRGRAASAKTVRDHELMLRVNHDVVLRRAVDIILGLKALDHVGL